MTDRQKVHQIIDALDSIDFNGIMLEDWEIVVLLEKVKAIEKMLWRPKNVNINTLPVYEDEREIYTKLFEL